MLRDKRTTVFTPPTDWQPVRTADGSFTLFSHALGEHYHSLYGALAESLHVYIANGLQQMPDTRLQLLEVGFGTGLNALLTWVEADRSGKHVEYHALEPYPLPVESWLPLGYSATIGEPDREAGYRLMMAACQGAECSLSRFFRFRLSGKDVQHLDAEGAFDLIYYDAFAPAFQPELWTLPVFASLFRSLRPGGMLVTYCAKGDVRRAMQLAGFSVQRLQGPPGKQHMLQANKPR